MLFFDMDAFITITCTSNKIIPITVDYIKRTSNKQKPYNKKLKSHSHQYVLYIYCLLYTSPSPRDQRGSRMPSSA